LGDRVDALYRPAFVEEPPLMVIYGTLALELLLILGWIQLRRMSNKATLQRRSNRSSEAQTRPELSYRLLQQK
jgi:hypothetical protein